jgi:hypothetical protein
MRHFFESYILIQQDIISSNEAVSKFLSLPGIAEVKDILQQIFFDENAGSSFKWQKLEEALEQRLPKQVNLISNLFSVIF